MGGWNRWSYHFARDISKTLNDPNVVSNAEMQRRIKACEKTPKQRVIEKVLDQHFHAVDMIQMGKQWGINDVGGAVRKKVVEKWCAEFNVPCNTALPMLLLTVKSWDKTTSRDDKDVREHIKAELDAFDEAERSAVKAAQDAYDALPKFCKVPWGVMFWILMGICFLIMLPEHLPLSIFPFLFTVMGLGIACGICWFISAGIANGWFK